MEVAAPVVRAICKEQAALRTGGGCLVPSVCQGQLRRSQLRCNLPYHAVPSALSAFSRCCRRGELCLVPEKEQRSLRVSLHGLSVAAMSFAWIFCVLALGDPPVALGSAASEYHEEPLNLLQAPNLTKARGMVDLEFNARQGYGSRQSHREVPMCPTRHGSQFELVFLQKRLRRPSDGPRRT